MKNTNCRRRLLLLFAGLCLVPASLQGEIRVGLSQVFAPQFREVNVDVLADEVEFLEKRIGAEMEEALEKEQYETAEEIERLRVAVHELRDATVRITLDDVTDEKMKLDETKCRVAQALGQLTSGKQVQRLRTEYQTAKKEAADIVNESGNDFERRQLREVVTREHTFLHSTNPKKLEEAINELRHVKFQILRRKPDFLMAMFHQLIEKQEVFNDQPQARNLITAGKRHIATEDWGKLDEVICCLYRLLPEGEADSDELRLYRMGVI